MARKKAGDNQAEPKDGGSADEVEHASNVRADRGSIAIGSVSIGGDLSGSFTIGYTADQVSLLLTQITSKYQPKLFDGRCPYKGLEVFEEEDAELFFGRERLVEDLVGRVKESRAVFITGPSGSGKSSLVRAGLIPALKGGAIKISMHWLYETMKPGREPLKELSLTFSRLKSPELANYFQAHASEVNILNECAESVLSGRKDQRFVLFVDQFEEVFTQVNQEEERLAFLNMLAHAGTVENGRVIVLFAMRSDFVSNCATYPALNELLSQQFRQVGAMQPEELVSAVALPARHVGLRIEDELIAQIINDMKGEPGALPLMQFALRDLFDAQQEKGGVIALTLEDYLRHGGIRKSLERHADVTFARLIEAEQELARSIFSSLIEIGRGTTDTRRTALFDELIPANSNPQEVSAVVQRFADARLVITDEQAGRDTVTLAHEKLIDVWPWLKKLVNENRESIALQNEIANDAKEWEDHRRDSSYLYTGGRLANVREQLDAKKLVLNGTAYEFVKAGWARQRRTQISLIAGVSAIIGLLFLAVIVFSNQSIKNANIASTAQAAGTEAVAQAEEAQKQTNLALARQLAAQAQSIVVTRNSRQLIAVLLATQSMKIYPSSETAQVLLNNNLAARPITRMTHDSSVTSAIFSPDGKYVVSGSWDRTARIMEVSTGREIARMTHKTDKLGSISGVTSVAFSPDSKYVVSGGDDATARVWEAATGKEISRMTYDGVVVAVAFSSDGKYVVSSGCEKQNESGSCVQLGTRAWQAATGKELSRIIYDGNVIAVAFSPDSKYVVLASNDNTARVWDILTGREISRIVHDSNVAAVTFGPDSKYIVSGSVDHTAWVWEAETGKEIAHFTHDGGVTSLAFSLDGNYVVSGSTDRTARVWEVATGEEVSRMTYDGAVVAVAFSPDGKSVASGGDDATARVWEAATGKEIARMTHDSSVRAIAFGPDGKYVVSASWDDTAWVWEAKSGKEIFRATHSDKVWSVAFSPDGQYAVSASSDHTVRVWEVATGKEITRMSHDNFVLSVAISQDGKRVLSRSGNTAYVWESLTGKEISRMTHPYMVWSVAFSPDGQYVVSASDDKTARVWEAATGKEISRMTHPYMVWSVAFSPDGQYVVSASTDTRVWEAATGREIARYDADFIYSVTFSPEGNYMASVGQKGRISIWEASTGVEVAGMNHGGAGYSIHFSPNGKYLLSGSSDNTARLWEVESGKEIAHFTHDSGVTSLAFSPDGNYVVSGSADYTARVWEATTGREIARMLHDHIVRSVAFSPDSRYVVSGGDDGTIRVWLWEPNDLIANACEYLPRNLTFAEWEQFIGKALPYQAICPNLPIELDVSPIASSTP